MPTSFDADCYELAAGALPDGTSEEQKQELVKIILDAIEEYVGGLQG
jgi:hypothetical protein